MSVCSTPREAHVIVTSLCQVRKPEEEQAEGAEIKERGKGRKEQRERGTMRKNKPKTNKVSMRRKCPSMSVRLYNLNSRSEFAVM